MALPKIKPMGLESIKQSFGHPDWLYEIKYDGFRSLCYIERKSVQLVSRRNHTYKSFSTLCEAIAGEVDVEDAILDGEVVCLAENGVPQFRNLMYRRQEPHLYAFDLLWLNGEDLRQKPLVERKRSLRKIIRKRGRLLYADHIEAEGDRLFQIACGLDLEGIVAKYKHGKYTSDQTTWIKIRNRNYTQWQGREDLFKKKAA